jgi:hypothetical protein
MPAPSAKKVGHDHRPVARARESRPQQREGPTARLGLRPTLLVRCDLTTLRQRRRREEARGCCSTRSSTTSWRTINGRCARPPNGQLADARACCAGGRSSPAGAGSHRGAFLRGFGRPQGGLAPWVEPFGSSILRTTIPERPRGGPPFDVDERPGFRIEANEIARKIRGELGLRMRDLALQAASVDTGRLGCPGDGPCRSK